VVVDADDDHVLCLHAVQRTVGARGGRMAHEMTPDERREFLLGGTRTDEFGARNAVPGELVVRITPTHLVARADIAD
jgi:hypothetical protein